MSTCIFHSGGDLSAIVPDLIEIGFNVIDPIQPECMDPVAVKREYGDLANSRTKGQ